VIKDATAAKLEHPMKKEKEQIEASFKVTPQWRTNPLHEQGGSYTVKVSYTDSSQADKVYDNVKFPEPYINKIRESSDYKNGIIKEVTWTKSNRTLLKG
jgi:hypothetical protein|tara:strand:+ start:111 stop:407 length:297 start_codon:yes stop_codon:yes gene_type:complete